MTREEQFALVVQTMALREDQRRGLGFAGDVVAYACNQTLPPADPDFPPAEAILRLARPYVQWMYSSLLDPCPRPDWATDIHEF